ncbi:MAG TPA: neutral zinc metallopeptidase [Chitinophagaceae bacterium]|nr:neutral zinc metallopeptidase [Chitinophagaceae bacterium]HNF71580.1 neutral zinc metallopeptidase [Chitinophagaceae bacterium]
MRWQGRRESDQVEDRRGLSGGKIAAGGGGLAILIFLISWLMGGDPQQLLQNMQQPEQNTSATAPVEESEEEKAMSHFMRVTLADNEQIWDSLFTANQMQYRKPVLVLFRNRTQSPCGDASAQSGPFYCPADQKIYLDMAFFDELTQRLGAHGDFACAYVLSHEVAHHVQFLLGTTRKIHERQQQVSEREANRLSVALELQADFFAGVWTHYNQSMNQVLEAGDIEEALSAANAVGDDRLQKAAQGYVVPDAFTHGTSEQRMYWFKRGYQSGDLRLGNTFSELGL